VKDISFTSKKGNFNSCFKPSIHSSICKTPRWCSRSDSWANCAASSTSKGRPAFSSSSGTVHNFYGIQVCF